MTHGKDSLRREPESPRARSRTLFLLLLLVLLFVLVPFLFWHGTWFGRPLSEEETGKYLADTQRPRKTQHALVQIGERILRGDPSVKRWYPQVESLRAHEEAEIRATVAWVMGQDNQSPQFHAALLDLLQDANPLVRRNAALSLVRFGDNRGEPELLSMLRPFALRAPATGPVAIRLRATNPVNPGTLLGRIQISEDTQREIRSPVPGRVQRWLLSDGETAHEGKTVVFISPAEEQVWEALRALYLVGTPKDLETIEAYARGVAGMPERVRQQARLTMEAIERRAAQSREAEAESGPG